ncbi:secretory lipase family protein [Mycobacterium xenopi 4042]|uniref:Secretory lipase family protein n=1 Tax=Mycobacterium xenopi 4042 TaxID=1299334 RepID=X8DJA0_MYCXE|nr:secretory lipase family protein [Mycobacterium xenopi 4042]
MTTVGLSSGWRQERQPVPRPPLEEILEMPEVQYVFDNIKLGTAVPTPPILIVQAVHDYLIAVEDIDALADAYSGGGATSPTTGRVQRASAVASAVGALTLRWLQARFARRPLNERRSARRGRPCSTRHLRRHGQAGRHRGEGHHRQAGAPRRCNYREPPPGDTVTAVGACGDSTAG